MKITAILLLCILISVGCDSEEDEVVTANNLLTGNITGRVLTSDTNNTSRKSHEGVTVSLDGTSLTTQSDSSGYYILSGVKTGTYTIRYSKSGFGESNTVGFQFVGGGTTWADTKYMGPVRSTFRRITQITDTIYNTQERRLLIQTTDTSNISIPSLVCFGKDKNVSATQLGGFIYYKGHNTWYKHNSDTLVLQVTYRSNELYSSGFRPGDTAFISVYDQSLFTDYGTIMYPSVTYDSLFRYFALNAVGPRSNVVSFVVQ